MKPRIKFTLIYRYKEKYSVSEMCRFFDVSRSGYYDFVKRMDKPDRDIEIAELIRDCQEQTHYTYGYRRVQIWLDTKKNIYRNRNTVLRIMQKYSLLSKVRRKKYKKCGESLHKYPNLLNRDFHADKKNEKWATDITYIKTGQGFLFLSVIIDLHGSIVIAYKKGREQNSRLVLDTVTNAVEKEKVTGGLVLHSDQGFQYTSQEYFKLIQSYHITPSMSRRGNPYDNVMAENFFSILKTECINRVKLETYEEAEALIDEFIQFYNFQRIQLKTKLTPAEFRCQCDG